MITPDHPGAGEETAEPAGRHVAGDSAAPVAAPDAAFDAFVEANPRATYLQLAAWARVKAPNGWAATLVEAAAPTGSRVGARILLRRPGPVPWSFAYAPRGPIAQPWSADALAAFGEAAGRELRGGRVRAAVLRIDPEIEAGGELDADGASTAALRSLGWRPAPEIQPSVTRVVDLQADEAALWSDLRAKWRQYVNRARDRGVRVADEGEDGLPALAEIMAETQGRTGTPMRAASAYRDLWAAFAPGDRARLLIARGPAGDAQAALLLVRCGARVVEPYGGMSAAGAESRANYLLKWEAIRSSRAAGAVSYDMWGLVHPGIRQFKEGFGGREVRLIGAWELVLDRVGAAVYHLGERRRRHAPALTTGASTRGTGPGAASAPAHGAGAAGPASDRTGGAA
ncbi:MAG: peptidoglycan bridge formation glycyltransferase FemA/FemB family protein [Chloroflexi bacterium]|jgi:lipid II:glycine glycyltransferase (peptidoglycan interpeptide bridge formation enzyme)|nr:peptidoglycan bridge formation glycyltransferase FemA/FemB family protein [Chloroflexota bacterium]